MNLGGVRLPFFKIMTIGMLPSPLKLAYYRVRGYRIGKKVRIALGSVVEASEACDIGEGVRIGFFSILVGERISIGKRTNIRSMVIALVPNIEIGKDVTISETAIIRAQLPYADSRICIGDRAHIFPYTIIDPSRPLTIGPETAVGFATYIFTHGAYKNKLDGYPVVFGEVKIGKAVWLPCRVFIMPGVELGDDCVIGSGSIVTKSVPAGAFALGEPAKVIKTRDEFITHYSEEERCEILQQILAEFGAHIEHFGKVRVRQIAPDQVEIFCARKRSRVCLVKRFSEVMELERGDVVCCYHELELDCRDHLDARGIAWFSYEDRACAESLDELADAFREYLNRYGIQFDRR